MWYGIYQVSTRTLRYANAGAPAALAFTSAGQMNILGIAVDVAARGEMFEDTVFTARDYAVPPGCRILIYSDGANEITVSGGRQLSSAEFVNTCVLRLPARRISRSMTSSPNCGH